MKVTQLVAGFEDCTLPKEEWTHAAHFVMALWYCTTLPLPAAIQQIRNGIIKYNVIIGGKNTDTSGYHETITVFFTTRVSDYVLTNGITSLTDEVITEFLQQPFLEKDYIYRYYSRELLESRDARLSWASPDLLLKA